MTVPEVVTSSTWLEARKALLLQEKELTRQRDRVTTARRMLPMVEVEKDYIFEGPSGEIRLKDMFDGCQQLIVQHVMYPPEWEDMCPSCFGSLNGLSLSTLKELRGKNTAYAA